MTSSAIVTEDPEEETCPEDPEAPDEVLELLDDEDMVVLVSMKPWYSLLALLALTENAP